MKIRTKVTSCGLVIPKSLLQGIDYVDIHKINGVIVVAPFAEDVPIQHDKHVMKTELTLEETYYNSGFFNIRVAYDNYVRSSEGPITLVLGDSKREIEAYVNRSANNNGTARIMGRVPLRDWLQQNYRQGDKIPMSFVTPHRIVLGMSQSKDNSISKQRMRARTTEQGVAIPKSFLPNVEEVDIRKRNGVIEVAPLAESTLFSLSELAHDPTRKSKGIGEDAPFPLIELARNPIPVEITDASVNLDKYIYGE